ncbi:DUF6279 family lipoprotein [Variovorax sp. UMC13]|uniref:DUF6279 family lipoprotein n=1 Tax=Variovorax sp. UMC13 TaxID=1862326 RepID=UPI00218096CF|nr:DUF6279 family lipoprotein [Variovorax sp. UMC13]
MKRPRLWPLARWSRVGCALLLGAALAGCSAVKLAYNNLPELGYWWLDGYVDFNSGQTPRVREQLAALLESHRRNELPKFQSLLEKAAAQAPTDVTASEVCAVGDEVRDRLLATALEASQAGAELVASLDETQLRQVERKYAKNNATYARDWLERSVAQQHQKRYQDFLDRSEDFYGSLDSAQRQWLREAVDRSIFDPRRVDAERRQRQQESLALLRRFSRQAAPVPEVRAAIDAYAQRVAHPPAGPWQAYQQALLQESCANIAALHQLTRPDQRERAARRLMGYARDVRELIATPRATPSRLPSEQLAP